MRNNDNMRESPSRNLSTVQVEKRDNLGKLEKDFTERVTSELFLEGRVTVHPGGEEKPFQEEGTVYAKALRCDRGQCLEAVVSSLWLPYKVVFPGGSRRDC